MPVVRDPEDKKERILTSALRLFTEKGFEGTPIPDLAKDAGIGAGTIYRYYKNKEELVNELYRFWKNKLRETLAENYPEKQNPKTYSFICGRRLQISTTVIRKHSNF